MGKYEEAIERARQGLPMDEVFLELKGSEDERIRKGLVHFILYKAGNLLDEETEHKFVAYLERQKEQKPAEYLDLDNASQDYVYNHFCQGADFTPDYIKGLMEDAFIDGANWQKEQNPAEWSEEYREEDLRMRFAFYTYKDEDSVLYLSNVFVEETSRNKGFGTKILAAAEKVAETLGAIQIRLKVKQNSPANAWYRKHGYGYMAFEDGYDWLEKNLEYMKPKQEWSEEE